MVFVTILTALAMMDSGKIIKNLEMVNKIILTEVSMLENGVVTKEMEMGLFLYKIKK
jgi:hypothetical protein